MYLLWQSFAFFLMIQSKDPFLMFLVISVCSSVVSLVNVFALFSIALSAICMFTLRTFLYIRMLGTDKCVCSKCLPHLCGLPFQYFMLSSDESINTYLVLR